MALTIGGGAQASLGTEVARNVRGIRKTKRIGDICNTQSRVGQQFDNQSDAFLPDLFVNRPVQNIPETLFEDAPR